MANEIFRNSVRDVPTDCSTVPCSTTAATVERWKQQQPTVTRSCRGRHLRQCAAAAAAVAALFFLQFSYYLSLLALLFSLSHALQKSCESAQSFFYVLGLTVRNSNSICCGLNTAPAPMCLGNAATCVALSLSLFLFLAHSMCVCMCVCVYRTLSVLHPSKSKGKGATWMLIALSSCWHLAGYYSFDGLRQQFPRGKRDAFDSFFFSITVALPRNRMNAADLWLNETNDSTAQQQHAHAAHCLLLLLRPLLLQNNRLLGLSLSLSIYPLLAISYSQTRLWDLSKMIRIALSQLVKVLKK